MASEIHRFAPSSRVTSFAAALPAGAGVSRHRRIMHAANDLQRTRSKLGGDMKNRMSGTIRELYRQTVRLPDAPNARAARYVSQVCFRPFKKFSLASCAR